MNIQFRVSRDWSDISGVYTHISSLAEKMAVFQHTPDQGCSKLHYHMYAFGVKIGEDTLRKFLKKQSLYDSSGNPDWALSQTCGKRGKTRPVDLSGAWIYGSKGKISDAFNLRKNISPATVVELEALSKAFWAGGEVVLNGIAVKKPREKKTDDKYTICEEILNKFKTNHKCDRLCDESQHLHKFYEIAIELLRARRIRWHSYDLDRYVLPAFTSLSGVGFTTDENTFISGLVRKNLRQ